MNYQTRGRGLSWLHVIIALLFFQPVGIILALVKIGLLLKDNVFSTTQTQSHYQRENKTEVKTKVYQTGPDTDVVVEEEIVHEPVKEVFVEPVAVKEIDSVDEMMSDKEPIKIIRCKMCGTDNEIYEQNSFETPTCKQCGMLLLDY